MRFSRTFALICVVASGCFLRKTEPALAVIIEIDSDVASKCVLLKIVESDSVTSSRPAKIEGKEKIFAGISQGTLPDEIQVRAVGYLDEGCTMASGEETTTARGVFTKEKVNEVTLRLKRARPRSEVACDDSNDDDGDGKTDCDDPDCEERLCTTGALCVVEQKCRSGQCQGGRPKQCDSPATTCLESPGACTDATGCTYSLKPDAGCSDGDACTSADRCQADGSCLGTRVTCVQSVNPCTEEVGQCLGADGGCFFPPKAITASCNDLNNCTRDDQCVAGACRGTAIACPGLACAPPTNRCGLDGGCLYERFDAGTPCDNGTGVCTIEGECVPSFPYPPTNFSITQLKAPPLGPTILNCGESIIDTSGVAIPMPANWCNQPFVAGYIKQDGGPDALLVSLKRFVLAADAGLTLVGNKPVIFAVFEDAEVAGTIVTRAGASICSGGGIGQNGGAVVCGAGASGGGFASESGEGGECGLASNGPAASAERNRSASPLRGGCSGGQGGYQMTPAAPGGGGFQMSVAGVLTTSGVIASPGVGGAGAPIVSVPSLLQGGNGGGSGGVLFLEASKLVIDGGALTANGGGGGAGGKNNGQRRDGQPGSIDSAATAAGGTHGFDKGRGGAGGAGNSKPGDGENGEVISTEPVGGGGGGGSVGLIFLRGVQSCSLDDRTILSPLAVSVDKSCR
jgi:hypothetical protein